MRFSDQIDLFGLEQAPRCMRADLARCLGPCAARCSQSEYGERVDLARRFLEGDADRPLGILQERMRLAAERLQFEYAASLRDRAVRLEAVRREVVALQGTVDRLSFLYTVPGHGGEDRVYLIQRGAPRAEFAAPRTAAEAEHLVTRVQETLALLDPAPVHVQPHLVPEILLVARWFRLHPQELERTAPADSRPDVRQTA